jgi:O-antigen/teichoic acid export membrane protein
MAADNEGEQALQLRDRARVRPLSNASYLTAANIGVKAFALVFVVYAYHVLGSGLMGNYYGVLGIVGLYGIATDLGLGGMAVRDVAQNKTLANRYVSNLFALRLTVSAVAILLVVLQARAQLDPSLYSAAYIYAFTLLPLSVANTAQLVFQFSEQLSYSAIINVATSFVTASLGILLVFFGQQVLGLVIALTVVTTANALVQIWLIYTHFLPRRFELDLAWWPQLIRTGIPFAVLVLTNILYNYADRQILLVLSGCGHKHICKPVGEYIAAYRPLDILVAIFVSSINAAVLPAFTRVATESHAALARLMRTSGTLALVFGVPIAIFVTFYAHVALSVIMRPNDLAQAPMAAPAMAILVWTYPCILLLTLLYNALYALHKQRVVTIAFVVTLVFNVSLNLILIPHFSYLASAALTVASEVLNGTIVLIALRRSLGTLGLTRAAQKMGVVTAATVLTLWALQRYGIFVSAPIGAIVVLLGLRLTRVLGPAEQEILGRMPLFGRYARLLS